VIARLARDGRFVIPNIPQGVIAEIRRLVNFREQLNKEKQQTEAQINIINITLSWTCTFRNFGKFLGLLKARQPWRP